ncbi:MAG: restriction endonuclease [Thermomicrobiales bacterium]
MSEMPNWQAFLIPVLRVMQDGVIRSRQEMRGAVADLMGITAEQREIVLTSGQVKYENRMGWALSYLSNVGALERTARNRYRVTDGGLVVLKQFPVGATEPQLEEFAKNPSSPIQPYKRSFVAADADPVPGDIEGVTEMLDPMEQIEQGMARIHTAVAADLLQRLQSREPTFFESAVVRLLVAMGYGGADGKATVTQQSHDGGIDGVIDRDALGLDRVYIQAKRYPSDTGVLRPEVQAFVGALSGKATTGVFLTTGRFSKGAIEYAETAHTRVILIDGRRLADLMIRYGVGVQIRRTLNVVTVDEDFFE